MPNWTRDPRIGMATGGWLGGAVYDWSGGYNASFAAGALFGTLNLIVVGLLIWYLGQRRAVPARAAS